MKLKRHNPEYYRGDKKQVIKALEQLLNKITFNSSRYNKILTILSNVENGIPITDGNNNILISKLLADNLIDNSNEILLSKQLISILNNYWKCQ